MALSKIPDLPHSYKGQDYVFVDQLEDHLKQLECPICCDIVSEPLQTSCGHLFCRECYNKLKRECGKEQCVQCPVCKQNHTTMPDTFNERRVKNLKVRCTNSQYGCEWVGNLEDEMEHRTIPNSCQFEEIKCPLKCGMIIQRMTQSRHMDECSMRPHSCKHCGEEGPYWKMVQDHLQTCRRYPVKCPNGCRREIPREETASYKLKATVSAMKTKLIAKRQHVRDLKSEAQHKTERIQDLEKDVEAKTECIRDLEIIIKAKADQLRDLERNNKVMEQRICEYQRETKDKRQRIHELEKDNTAMTQHIHQLESKANSRERQKRDRKRATKRVAQLTAENSEKQEKIKKMKKLIVFALGIIVLFRLHPLYFIPLLILGTVVYV